MEPLDLTVQPPRGPREQLAGCTFMARTIDKVRAELPGGNLGDYVVAGKRSISAYVLHKLKIDVGELRAEVARARDEREVEEWLRARIDPAVVAEVNAKLLASRMDTMSEEDAEFVYSLHPLMRGRNDIGTTFDFLEADDAAAFAGTR
jgi:hypothetical protein